MHALLQINVRNGTRLTQGKRSDDLITPLAGRWRAEEFHGANVLREGKPLIDRVSLSQGFRISVNARDGRVRPERPIVDLTKGSKNCLLQLNEIGVGRAFHPEQPRTSRLGPIAEPLGAESILILSPLGRACL